MLSTIILSRVVETFAREKFWEIFATWLNLYLWGGFNVHGNLKRWLICPFSVLLYKLLEFATKVSQKNHFFKCWKNYADFIWIR